VLTTETRSLGLATVLVIVLSFSVLPARCRAEERERAYLHFNVSSHEEFDSALRYAEDLGAFLTHRFYPYCAVGTVQEGTEGLLASSQLIDHVYVGPVPSGIISAMETHEAYLAQAYNNLFFSAADAETLSGAAQARGEDRAGNGDRLPDRVSRSAAPHGGKQEALDASVPVEERAYTDCRRVPVRYLTEMAGISDESAPPPAPPAICEFMLGHVVVGLIMPESNPGVGSFDWSESEEETTVEETISAMEWWIENGPERSLWFTYDINYRVPIDVEPMAMGGAEIEDQWAGQSLEFLGYSGANHFDQCYKYIEAMREEYGADWGFVSFVLDGREDVSFGEYVSYGFIGGPFTVCINANGPIGPHNLDRIFGHVMGNTFYCLDEFSRSPFTCSDRSGYLNVENANKIGGGSDCKSDVPCIMRGAADPTVLQDMTPCYYTRGVIGWWDEDGDGIPDILDTCPALESVAVDTVGLPGLVREDTLFATELALEGTVVAMPIPNKNPFSLNSSRGFTVEQVRAEYRVNGGPWIACDPADGRFDSSEEEFGFTARGLREWLQNRIEVRGVTSRGNVTPDSLAAVFEFFVVQPETRSAYLRVLSSNPTRTPVSIGFVPYDPSVAGGALIAVEIAVYDALGRKIRVVESGEFASGEYARADWDGEDSNGRRVRAGVYLVGMACGGGEVAQKIIVVP
jgi:hypothetical protein